jgi:NitT/TauT family transport system ATP-binding protein
MRAGLEVAERPDAAMARDPVILRAHDLGKTYTSRSGEPVVAVQDVDFELARGEFIALVGPSGCGKSTTLNLIGGLITRTTGSLVFEGSQVTGPRREIGMMFQAPVLFPWRTALQNVLLPMDVRGEKRSKHRDRAAGLLELVGLAGSADRYPRELSGGMQQRVALARLLLEDPEVFLLDEPFGALDEFTREAMNLELLDIWSGSGKTVLLVTHNIQEAVFLSDRVFVMSPGPGRLTEVLDVDLPRPRRIPMMREQGFQDLVFEVRRVLGAL